MAISMQKMEKFKPHIAQVAVQVAYAGMNIITRVALVDGMNSFVFVTYRQIVATLVIAPLAYVLEREQRPPLTRSIFLQIFLLALCGITVNQNLYFAGLYYTNSTFASATTNLIPVVTFVMATVLRYEKVEIRKMRGKAKVVGTTICVGGAMVITLYKGPVIKLLTAYNSTANYNNILGSKRVLGCILLFASVFTWSSWITFQVPVAKKYPAELSLTALMCMLGAVQSGVLAFICEYKTPSVWSISWNIELLSYVYTVQ
jgi:drug/metabolite transporter (DMT)-like permease